MGKNKRWKNRQRFQPAQRQELLPKVDLGYLNASIVTVREWRTAQIILVGAGGIGAYMAQHIGRLMRVVYQSERGCHLTIVDPDCVEYRNIGRQLFCDAEVGRSKAECLARRYGHAWGLNVSSFHGRFEDALIMGADLTLIVGCVDNAEARRSIHQVLELNDGPLDPARWWLDCGNLFDTGRVLLGSSFSGEDLEGAFMEQGKCFALPSPALQSPGLLQPQKEELEGSDLSCAEAALRNLQSLNINARIAAEAADFVARLLITRDLKRFACEVNLAAGTSKSTYVTAEGVARAASRPVSWLTETPTMGKQIDASTKAEAEALLEELITRNAI